MGRAGTWGLGLASLVAGAAVPVFAQPAEHPIVSAGALGPAVRIDGVLDEPEWGLAPPARTW